MHNSLSKKRVLVTGVCGTVGKELVRQLLEHGEIEELIAIDNNETELFFIQQRFLDFQNARFLMADVRDGKKISRLMQNIDVVFHTAAYKHVILCEKSPFEAVQTNIMGVQNIIRGAYENQVERVLFTSSDKAVNPTSVMGTSKLMGERLMTAANINFRGGANTRFASTRFGNVLGSRGSVIPIFKKQVQKGGPITLTDPDMTRFIMSIDEAVRLIIESAGLINGGEVFITKMPVIRIKDLAEVMIETLAPQYGWRPDDIQINIIGTKPGEKMYEELMSSEETRRAMELSRYFVVCPALANEYGNGDFQSQYAEIINDKVDNPYNSSIEKPLTKSELKAFLTNNHLFEEEPVD